MEDRGLEKRNCHTLCVMLPSEYNAIYIDTESDFRPERIKSIAKARGLDSEQILRKILVTKALDCKQQESHIRLLVLELTLREIQIPRK